MCNVNCLRECYTALVALKQNKAVNNAEVSCVLVRAQTARLCVAFEALDPSQLKWVKHRLDTVGLITEAENTGSTPSGYTG